MVERSKLDLPSLSVSVLTLLITQKNLWSMRFNRFFNHHSGLLRVILSSLVVVVPLQLFAIRFKKMRHPRARR